jgi:tRNA uracil 4-sulfurtransferase
MQTILIRFGAELAIKSRRTRQNFLNRLGRNVRDALSSTGEPFELRTGWNRFVATISSDAQLHTLAHVFGISSVSVIDAVVPADLGAIVERGRELYAERVRGRTYAVRARRHGLHPFASKDIEIELGRALNEGAKVDLRRPDVVVNIEVRDDEAFLFGDRIDVPGGLPLGVEGNAISLISGGYDSAVSAWLLLKRGVSLDYVFCNLGGDAYERAVVHVAKVLADDWSFGSHPRLHVVDFGAPLDELRSKALQRYWQVVLKRLMYRTASAIATEREAHAIVTGEALGQVSSQTLVNLRAIEPAASFPVFRPLIGFDKEEIIDRAKAIGTAALSEQVKEYCAIAPGHPVTAAPVEHVAREEAKLDLSVLDVAVASRKVLDLRSLTAVDLVQPYLFIDDVPADAIVLDCRPEAHYRAWHWPGAKHREEWDLLNSFDKLPRDPKYVLYCAHGIQTAYLAERMQRSGYEAYSFRGGAGELRRFGEKAGVGSVL